MVKRMQHIGTFLHNEMGVSLTGMSPMCCHFVNPSSENLFLKVYRMLSYQQVPRSIQVWRGGGQEAKKRIGGQAPLMR